MNYSDLRRPACLLTLICSWTRSCCSTTEDSVRCGFGSGMISFRCSVGRGLACVEGGSPWPVVHFIFQHHPSPRLAAIHLALPISRARSSSPPSNVATAWYRLGSGLDRLPLSSLAPPPASSAPVCCCVPTTDDGVLPSLPLPVTALSVPPGARSAAAGVSNERTSFGCEVSALLSGTGGRGSDVELELTHPSPLPPAVLLSCSSDGPTQWYSSPPRLRC